MEKSTLTKCGPLDHHLFLRRSVRVCFGCHRLSTLRFFSLTTSTQLRLDHRIRLSIHLLSGRTLRTFQFRAVTGTTTHEGYISSCRQELLPIQCMISMLSCGACVVHCSRVGETDGDGLRFIVYCSAVFNLFQEKFDAIMSLVTSPRRTYRCQWPCGSAADSPGMLRVVTASDLTVEIRSAGSQGCRCVHA